MDRSHFPKPRPSKPYPAQGKYLMIRSKQVSTEEELRKVIAAGYIGNYKLNVPRIENEQRHYIVLVALGGEKHNAGQLIFEITGFLEAPTEPEKKGIQFTRTATIDVPNIWRSVSQNSVSYPDNTLKEAGIDIDELDWVEVEKPLPNPTEVLAPTVDDAHSLLKLVIDHCARTNVDANISITINLKKLAA